MLGALRNSIARNFLIRRIGKDKARTRLVEVESVDRQELNRVQLFFLSRCLDFTNLAVFGGYATGFGGLQMVQ